MGWLVARLRDGILRFSDSVDYCWSGAWWWLVRCWQAERALAEALERYGENSLEARRATERYRVVYFGVKYWRPAPPLVRHAVETAERGGVSRNDLRLLALNRDIRQIGNTIKVRRTWWMPVLASAAVIAFGGNWAYLVATVALSSWAGPVKVATIIFSTVFFWVTWPGFSLYTTRAFAAVKRSGDLVQGFANLRIQPAKIHNLSHHQ